MPPSFQDAIIRYLKLGGLNDKHLFLIRGKFCIDQDFIFREYLNAWFCLALLSLENVAPTQPHGIQLSCSSCHLEVPWKHILCNGQILCRDIWSWGGASGEKGSRNFVGTRPLVP